MSDNNDEKIIINQKIKKILKNTLLKYLKSLFLIELIINIIATSETPKSDKNGPVIRKAGNKIII